MNEKIIFETEEAKMKAYFVRNTLAACLPIVNYE